MPASAVGETLHLFSNALDVPRYDPLRLLEQTLSPGRHTIVAVSHDRDFNEGTPEIEDVKAAVEDPGMAPELTITHSTLTHFKCDNERRSDGVLWLCQLEIHDG